MIALSESDLSLLRLISTLTLSYGRSPTWAELALAAGLQESSRGNLQRQLTPLKPLYVVWDSTPRSLNLTDAARMLLGLEDEGGRRTDPIADDILRLLACGLSYLVTDIEQNRPLQALLPAPAQRGINRLAAACLARGVTPPAHIQEVMTWCRRPLSQWPVRFETPGRQLTEPLLTEDDHLTTFARELADGLRLGSAEHELCERLIGQARRVAELRRDQQAYVTLRRFLIEHAVIAETDLIHAANSPELGLFGNMLYELYERVPESCRADQGVVLCGHCGWTLIRDQGRLRCDGTFCSVLTDNFTRQLGQRPWPVVGDLLRVRRAIRRYIVAPGIHELFLEAQLLRLGLTVTLWPEYDLYDLHILFPHGQRWAIDVKDWKYPHLLAPRLTPIPTGDTTLYDQALYAIPDARAQQYESYMTYLRTATTGQPFRVLTIGDIVKQARELRGERYA